MNKPTVAQRLAELCRPQIWTRSELREQGMSGRQITSAVRSGALVRVRRDRYAAPGLDPWVAESVRIGGRLSCLSLLAMIGVFVLHCADLHVHVRPGTSRIRPPGSKRTVLHWSTWSEEESPHHVASLVDAVRQAITCQQPRAALATLDSVVHHGILQIEQLKTIFAGLPTRYGALLPLVDASAESGPETFMRLILRSLGVSYRTQVFLPGVGRVDFVVDGWLIIECDSKEHHQGWERQLEDRRRDFVAAQLGYVTIRPVAADILSQSQIVQAKLRMVIAALGPQLGTQRCA